MWKNPVAVLASSAIIISFLGAAAPATRPVARTATQPVLGGGARNWPATQQRPLVATNPAPSPELRQEKRIQELEQRVAALEDLLRSSGLLLPKQFEPAEPRSAGVVIICDISGSMADKYPEARRIADRIIRQLPRDASFTVLAIGEDQIKPFYLHLVRADEDVTKDRARKFLESLKPSGGGSVAPALRSAINMKPSEIVLLSDGDEPFLEQLHKQVEIAATLRIPIHVVPTLANQTAGRAELEKIARATGGRLEKSMP